MRRFAGRFAALVLALLMLLSSMPLTALAEQVVPSKSFDLDVSTTGVEPAPATSKTAAELAQEAVNQAVLDNSTSGRYLNVFRATPPKDNPKTGEWFYYTIGVQYASAAKYQDPETGATNDAYDYYKDIKITVTAPEHIELEKTEYTLGDIRASEGGSRILTVRARMTNNGVAKDGFDYGALEVKIEAKITPNIGENPETTTIEYTFADNNPDNDSGNVTNTATADWQVEKTMAETGAFVENAADNTVTVTWTITVSRTDKTYDTTGTLNFAENGFTLTDTLPKVGGFDPTSATITSGGITLSSTMETDADGNKTISTTHYATTALTGDAANAANTPTPAATTYKVQAVYPRSAFVLPWNETQEISVTNKAKIEYKLVGEEDPRTDDDEVTDDFGITTPGGDLTIVEQLNLAGKRVVDYNSYYAQAFAEPEGGVQFEVSKWNEENSAYELVKINGKNAVTVDVTEKDAKVTLTNLEPGDYQIKQISRPVGSDEPASFTQDVTIVSGKKDHELTFINPTPDKRILTIRKVDGDGNLITNVTNHAKFKVEVEGGATQEIPLNNDGQFVLAINVDANEPTTVTITEISAPDGYIKSTEPQTVTFNPTNASDPFERTVTFTNYQTVTGTLTINKNVADYDGDTGTAISGISGYSFTFKVYRSTDSQNISTTSDAYREGTLTSGSSIQITGLEVADENGNPYYYKVVEEQGTDSRFVYDDAEPTFNFVNAEGGFTTTASVTFTNVLKGNLQVTKRWSSYDANETRPAISFALYTKEDDAYIPVEGATFGSTTANVYTTPYLPVADEDGTTIQYYLKEAEVDGYTPSYSGVTGADGYYGPITLTGGTTVDVAVTNTKNEGELIVKKTDSTGKVRLKGATFTVSVSEDALTDDQATALTALDFTLKGENYEASLTTGDNGTASIEGLPLNVAFTVTETGVPDGYITSGKVDGDPSEGPLTAIVTLTTPQASKTVTFANDKNPTLTVNKKVGDTTQAKGTFTFELYTKDGENYNPVKDADNQTITFKNDDTITLEVDKVYAVKETGWPAGVVAPAEGNLTLVNEENATQANRNYTLTIDNTSSLTDLTILKKDARTGDYLAGATVKVTVSAEDIEKKSLTADEIALLTASGFDDKEVEGTYTKTVTTTDTATGVTISGLPAFRADGVTPFTYTVEETNAPANYQADAVEQTIKLLNEETELPEAKTVTLTNTPLDTITVTKTWYSQWDDLNDNKISRPLSGVQLGLFVMGEGGSLEHVGDATTGADGVATFTTQLDGTKTYYVFEYAGEANENLAAPGDKEFIDAAADVVGETGDSLDQSNYYYYYVKKDLNDPNFSAATVHELDMENVEKYVQLSLYKFAIPERPLEEGEQDTDDYPNDDNYVDIDGAARVDVDHAKFNLYGCTIEEYETLRDPENETDLKENYTLPGDLSEYVYESGTGENAGSGYVVTGALPGGYVYWFYEIETPSGFIPVDKLDFKYRLSPKFVPTNDNTTLTGEMENHYAHGGPGTIRYLQFALDKVAEDESGNRTPLANTTFKVYLSNADGDRIKLVIPSFTTGVDLPDDGGAYNSGHAISSSIKMHELWEEYDQSGLVKLVSQQEDQETGVVHKEYAAYFLLVETAWPDNTTPVNMEYLMYVTTNGNYDTDNTSESDTIWSEYTTGEGKKGPIVNKKATLVPVVIKKVGYNVANPDATWPLEDAEFTVYEKLANGEYKVVDTATTNDLGRATFALEPDTTYYYEETTVPEGYEAVTSGKNSFTTHLDTKTEYVVDADPTTSDVIDPVKNVEKRVLKLTKTNADGEPVAGVTFGIYQGTSATGRPAYTTEPTGTDGKTEIKLPAGTYTIVEEKIGDSPLTAAEKQNFKLLNADKLTVTFGTLSEVEVVLTNPSNGKLDIEKVDNSADKTKLSRAQFTLSYKQFTSAADAKGETAPTSGYDNLPGETAATILTTGADGADSASNLIPGWYKLEETTAPTNYEKGATTTWYFKIPLVGAGNTKSVAYTGDNAIVNYPYAKLTVEKAFENLPGGATWPTSGTVNYEISKDDTTTPTPGSLTSSTTGSSHALPSGTYTITEKSVEGTYDSDDFYTKYTVEDSGIADENTTAWRDSASATINSGANGQPTTGTTVTFTNVYNRASLTAYKEDENGTALEGAKFVLYYTEGGNNSYYNHFSESWLSWSEDAVTDNRDFYVLSDEDGEISFEDIKLPKAMFTEEGATITTDEGELFHLKEVKAPDDHTLDPEHATEEVTLIAGQTTTVTSAFVNKTAVSITLTKHNKPYKFAGEAEPLAGAGFTLYKKVEDGDAVSYVPVGEQKITPATGMLSFTNLERLDEGECYYLRETTTPPGYVEGSTEVYLGDEEIKSETVNGNKYFPIPGGADNTTLDVYNKPKSQIVVLKYDYVDKTSLPTGAIFSVSDQATTIEKTREANASDPPKLPGGYTKSADGTYYEKDGVHYAVAFSGLVDPEVYTVTETSPATGYLNIISSTPNDAWHGTKQVPVPENGDPGVVVFANVPDPKGLDVTITKDVTSTAPLDSLQEEGGQEIIYTISGFNTLPLAVNSAVVTDEGLTFAPPNSGDTVDWEITSLTIEKATYDKSNPFYEEVTTEVRVEVKVGADWKTVGQTGMYTVASSRVELGHTVIGEDAQGFRLTYYVDGSTNLPGGFKAGDVTLTVKASQPIDNESVVPVETITNHATYAVEYAFGTGSETTTAEASASDTALVTVDSTITLPEATLTKTLWGMDEDNNPTKEIDQVQPNDNVKYVIELKVTKNGTRNGEAWGMIDPVIVDQIPSQLKINSATYTVTGGEPMQISLAGQVIRVAPEDLELTEGQTLTVEVYCTVLDIAALEASIDNTAYAYSDYVLPLTISNPQGASFKESGADEYPSIEVPSSEGKKGIMDDATATVAKTQSVSISKFVSDGTKTVGSSGYLTVSADGEFTYTINVNNYSDDDIENVWIADMLPMDADGRNSEWSPTLGGVVKVSDGSKASVYYSTTATGGDAVLNSYAKDQTTPPEGFEGDFTGAKTILVIVPKIAENSTVTVTIPCTAPSGEDANSAYYYMAVNNAQMRYAGGPPTPDESSVTNVTLMPPTVSIGDTVWIDRNNNGIQDDAATAPPAVTLTLHTFDSATEQAIRTDRSDTNGGYDFDRIYPAAPKPGATGLYDHNGDVKYESLVGLARYTYRLTASLPDGYRLAEQYEQNGGSVPKVGEANRENDSNFGSTGTGNTVQTERFYVPAGPGDMTYDLGLVRERVLTINKKGDNEKKVSDATFAIYGPYAQTDFPLNLLENNKYITTITTKANGVATYGAGTGEFLNAYQYYVVVETSVPLPYSDAKFVPSGKNLVTDATVSSVAEGKKYFVLGPDNGTDMEGAVEDEVTVINEYIAEGKLIINGTKAVDGVLAEDTTFTFTLTGEEGAPMPSKKTKTATVAKGETSAIFTFPEITYTYDDVDKLVHKKDVNGDGFYTYTLEETAGNANTGIVYDTTKYTIKVELRDTDGDGKINVYAYIYKNDATEPYATLHSNDAEGNNTGTVNIPAGTMTFTNRVEGGFSVKKVEKGNAASSDDIDSFEFTLTLDSDQTFQMKKGADETTVSTTNKTYTFSLKDDETITFSGLLVGTKYTVEETSYTNEGYVTTLKVGDATPTEINTTGEQTIIAAGNPQIVFTNTRDVGNLAVSKTVAGTDWDGPFNFNLTLTNAAGLKLDGTYTVTGIEGMQSLVVTPGETTDDGTTTGTASFQLKDGDAITIYGIPAGTAFIVTEQAPTGEPSYDALGYVTAAIVAQNSIEAGKTATVAFTNTRHAGDLKVTKAVDEATLTNPNAQVDQAYSITVTLTPPEPGKHVGGSYTVYEAGGTVKEQSKPIEGAGTQTITVSLKANEYVLFEDLLKDTRYTVTENVTDALIQAGFVVPTVADSGNGKITTVQSDVTVTNDIPVGSLSVYKTVTGDDVETDREFQFTLTMTGANMGNGVIADVDGIYKVSGTAGFTALRVENGKATFTLEDSEIITIEGIREGTVCTVEEDDYSAYGYTTTCAPSNSNSATISATTPQTINVVNTREVVDLKIEKVVAGNVADSGKPFSFTLTLESSTPLLANAYGNTTLNPTPSVEVENGTYTYTANFTLKHEDTITFTNIPAGTTYTVTEADYKADGYLTINKVGNVQSQERYIATGTLGTADETVTVTYTNTRNVGDLQVSKTVAGNDGDEGKDFNFNLTLTNAAGLKLDGTYTVTGIEGMQSLVVTPGETTDDGTTTGTASFQLKDGDAITIYGIPAGTAYTVTEADYKAEGYVTEVSVNNQAAPKAEGTIPTDDEQQPLETVAFTNTRNVGNLTVTKTVTGEGADAPGVPTAFKVTVTLEAPTGVNLVGMVDGQNITQAEGFNGQTQTFRHTFTLAGGASVVFTDLPTGTKYEVTEADYTAQGFVTTYNTVGDAGNDKQIDANDEGECITVTVNNHRPAAGLTITKNIGGSGSSEDDEFTFEVSLTRTDDVLVDGEYNWTFNPAKEGDQTTFNVTNGVGTVTLKGGQTVTIEDIPVGTTYTVTELTESGADAEIGEIDTNGYTLTKVSGATGTIEDEKGIYTATFQNERYVGDLTVEKLVVGNAQSAPNALTKFDITVTLTAPTGVDLAGTVNSQPVQPTQTFTLEAGESVEFIGLPEGTTYVVTEADYSANGYAATFADDETGDGATADTATSANGTIVRSETGSVTATVTNTKYVGSLQVSKTTVGTGADQSKAFEFTLTLTGANGTNVNGTYDVTGIDQPTLTVENGAASFTLTHGQTITIDGIPAGTTYKVEETVPTAEGYEQPTMTGQTGTIRQEATAQASFINRRDVGNLTVTKIVAGNGEGSPNALTAFDITVELTAPAGVDLVGTVNSQLVQPTQTFTLADGQSVKFVGLPEGTQYEVSEADYSANGYETTYTAKTGTIEPTLESAAGVTSTVTNTLDTRSLSVSKIANGSGAETEKEFTFQLTLVNNDLNVNGTYQVEGVEQQTLTVEGGRASFTLTGGQTITILGIPENTRYLVTENDYIADGYVTSEPDNAQGQLNGQNATVAFTNTRDVGELTIQKTVNGALGDANRDFEFTLTLVPGENGVPVDGTYDATLHTAAGSEATTVSVEDGVSEAILLSGGERLVIHELPAGASYIVREASYQSLGYDTSASGQTGTIPATGSMPVAGFTNTRNGGSLIIEKALAGNAPIDTDTFEFTVTLSHPDGVDLNGSYQTLVNGESGEPVEFVGGEATVQITGAGTLEILGILAETDYEVTENLPATSDYELISSEGVTGAIPVDDAATASFTNERNVGSLTLSKAVAGNAAETDREFDFTVFMTDRYGRNLNGAYAMRGDAGSSVTFTNGYASISLYAGQSATIDGILEGTYYSVTEDDANTDGYVTTSSGTTGLIGTGTSTASFLNTRNVTEEFTSVTVYKAWNDEDDADGVRPESITVYLYADGEAVDSAVLTAAGGWSTVFDGLPVYSAAGEAITYRVIEVSTVDYFASYAYAASIVNITNTHNPDDFTPRTPDDPMLLTLIEDNIIPLGGNVNMNEGDCFN